MMKQFLLLGGFVSLLTLSSCSFNTTKGLYSWHGYQDATYAYSKSQTPEKLKTLMETYEQIISSQRGARRVVPPGIYAEYGYLLAKQGQVAKGIELMKQEIALYPESQVFVGRIIKQLEKK